jgi:hypothetical protein
MRNGKEGKSLLATRRREKFGEISRVGVDVDGSRFVQPPTVKRE